MISFTYSNSPSDGFVIKYYDQNTEVSREHFYNTCVNDILADNLDLTKESKLDEEIALTCNYLINLNNTRLNELANMKDDFIKSGNAHIGSYNSLKSNFVKINVQGFDYDL